MSDREFGGSNDDLSLPKATVQKIIQEILSNDLSFAKDARDLLIECCVEFITLISSEANEIAEKEAKKTIAAEHVVRALKDLGFEDYIEQIQEVAQEHKEHQKSREKKQTKMEQSGLTEEELLRQQEELFGKARDKYNQNAQG
ncbi:histone-fold-containing protein [Tirmania nivea]|uniref:NCT transcriptional regulatory complex subunit B n=1 Tax=Terfezia boudieri ATCC MYA-4762 TaxID=1051890 RepID=A0A3N4LS94_9PEZI|nr:histone-fold-containing protein [Tirmania nivea]KAF8453613.1 histone-fold-containing protein [Terfezia claveryi]RPB23501.1 histone-fold-containing protein [Terfezia boudieri ATCC MYA-4762]